VIRRLDVSTVGGLLGGHYPPDPRVGDLSCPTLRSSNEDIVRAVCQGTACAVIFNAFHLLNIII